MSRGIPRRKLEGDHDDRYDVYNDVTLEDRELKFRQGAENINSYQKKATLLKEQLETSRNNSENSNEDDSVRQRRQEREQELRRIYDKVLAEINTKMEKQKRDAGVIEKLRKSRSNRRKKNPNNSGRTPLTRPSSERDA